MNRRINRSPLIAPHAGEKRGPNRELQVKTKLSWPPVTLVPGDHPTMNSSPNPETIRLTMSQAVVKYLQSQYSERDGRTRRLIPAMFGIFGHGNVCGMGQALEECGRDLPYYQPCNEQSMVHTAIGFAKANRRLATLACTASIGPGSTNMITGAAAATINRLPVLLFPSDYYATRHQGPVLAAARAPGLGGCQRQRLLPASQPVLRPDQPARADSDRLAGSDARADRPGRDGDGHHRAAAGHPGARLRLSRSLLPRTPAGGSNAARPTLSGFARRSRLLAESQRPVILAGGGVHYSEAWRELQEFAEALGIPVGETFAGKGAMRGRLADGPGRPRPGGDGCFGHDRRAGRPGALRRHTIDRLHHRLAVVLPAPERPVHQHQRLRP